jgi:Fic family protein
MSAGHHYQPGRSGAYRSTSEGFRAFHPKPLPPDPPLAFDETLIGRLASASAELGRLDGAAEILPDPDFFVYSYVRKEAVLSSQIEGTRSSLADLFDFEAGAEGRRVRQDVREVSNYVTSLNFALEQVRRGVAVSTELLQRTHAQLMRGVRGNEAEPGALKSRQNWIGPSGSSPLTAEFVPPPPDETPAALAALTDYIRTGSLDVPLIKAGLAHAQFESIHPFLDGNGRMGRLLVTLILTTSGAVRRPVLYLSYYLLKHREEYIQRLQRVRDDGDWEGWLVFFLTGVEETSIQAAETARAILALKQEHELLIERDLGRRAGSGHKLLEHLFRQPVVNVGTVASLLGSTFPPASELVKTFAKLGLLTELTGQKRNRFFRYTPYVELLQQDRVPTPSPRAASATTAPGPPRPRTARG